jgi:hypothetical protein
VQGACVWFKQSREDDGKGIKYRGLWSEDFARFSMAFGLLGVPICMSRYLQDYPQKTKSIELCCNRVTNPFLYCGMMACSFHVCLLICVSVLQPDAINAHRTSYFPPLLTHSSYSFLFPLTSQNPLLPSPFPPIPLSSPKNAYGSPSLNTSSPSLVYWPSGCLPSRAI